MNKEIVPYTESLEMKQLGFDELCYYGWYDGEYKDIINYDRTRNSCGWLNDSSCSAPTFSQAFRWFREKYQLQGYVYSTTVRGTKEGGKTFSDYCWHINGIDVLFLQTDARDMERVTYEEAELACLRKLIEIVKNK